eukprot:TRINITY_DN11954_c0_g2_i1.p1 TRINITY_DN11954_c0_g2~~TRINITY_DN11954_c0_g2_i1.p1  ORF type:complete len:184 (+),score=45.20 TRINITY_DN11954_c0_g2_i1:111-662(+)
MCIRDRAERMKALEAELAEKEQKLIRDLQIRQAEAALQMRRESERGEPRQSGENELLKLVGSKPGAVEEEVKKRLFDPSQLNGLTEQVEVELHALRTSLAQNDEQKGRLEKYEHVLREHYRSRYGHLKPHHPEQVLGSKWTPTMWSWVSSIPPPGTGATGRHSGPSQCWQRNLQCCRPSLLLR